MSIGILRTRNCGAVVFKDALGGEARFTHNSAVEGCNNVLPLVNWAYFLCYINLISNNLSKI